MHNVPIFWFDLYLVTLVTFVDNKPDEYVEYGNHIYSISNFGRNYTPSVGAYEAISNVTDRIEITGTTATGKQGAFLAITFFTELDLDDIIAPAWSKYFLYAKIRHYNTTSMSREIIYFYKNGSVYVKYEHKGNNVHNSIQISKVANLSAGDYIEVYYFQNSGSNNNLTQFSSDSDQEFTGYRIV